LRSTFCKLLSCYMHSVSFSLYSKVESIPR
jgi:hypothetical protein